VERPLFGRHGELAVVSRLLDSVSSGPCALVLGGTPASGRVLAQHPSVADVGVVGVHVDGEKGGAAFVVVEPESVVDQDALLRFAKARLDDLEVPRNSVGKLQRSRLAAKAAIS